MWTTDRHDVRPLLTGPNAPAPLVAGGSDPWAPCWAGWRSRWLGAAAVVEPSFEDVFEGGDWRDPPAEAREAFSALDVECGGPLLDPPAVITAIPAPAPATHRAATRTTRNLTHHAV